MRTVVKNIAYAAIRNGRRLPDPMAISQFRQLSKTVDLLRQMQIDLVLDVGANQGWYAYHLRKAGYRGDIVSFEPIAREFEKIIRLSANDENWTAQCCALGEENGIKDFNVILAGGNNHEETVLSSFLDSLSGIGNSQSTEKVKIRRLDSVLSELSKQGKAPKIFLKMDTQGYDQHVFRGAGVWQEHVFMLQSEIYVLSLYKGMVHYTEALRTFHDIGFLLKDLFVVNRTATGDVLEYDCLMYRHKS